MYQPLSFIHPGAKIAKNVVVEPFSSIDNNVIIGQGTWIGSNVTIMSGARIGRNCSIFPGTVISAVPQDLKFNGEETTAVIGDNTTVRECVTINRGTNDRNKTVIGKDCLIMAYSHIAHDCFIGNNCIFSNNSTLAGHVTVGSYVILAGMVAIHQFCSIGNHAFVAGGSLVRKDIPPFVKAAREPISYVGINSVGLRRRNFNQDTRTLIKKVYSLIYRSKLNTMQAINEIKERFNDKKSIEINNIIEFIENSERGII